MKNVSGIMLIAYVSVAVLVQELGSQNILDAATVDGVQATIDVPTMLALVIFTGLTVRLELFKPRYKLKRKQRPVVDAILIVACVAIIVALMLLKYWK